MHFQILIKKSEFTFRYSHKLDNVTLVSFKGEEKNEEDKLNDLYTPVSFISYDRLEAAYGLNKKERQ